MKSEVEKISSFNSALEAGLRSVCLLEAGYPNNYDLQKLVLFDYYIVHTGEVGGPESMHPNLPHKTMEFLVRRKLIESGLLLMMSRNLVERDATNLGITYRAGEMAHTFLTSLTARYTKDLKSRAMWVVTTFGDLNGAELKNTSRKFFDNWIEEFQTVQKSLGS